MFNNLALRHYYVALLVCTAMIVIIIYNPFRHGAPYYHTVDYSSGSVNLISEINPIDSHEIGFNWTNNSNSYWKEDNFSRHELSDNEYHLSEGNVSMEDNKTLNEPPASNSNVDVSSNLRRRLQVHNETFGALHHNTTQPKEENNQTETNRQNEGTRLRVCSQQERLDHIKQVCRATDAGWRRRLLQIRRRSIIDHKHGVIMCWISKAGNTALKALLLKANGFDLENNTRSDSMEVVHSISNLRGAGLQHMMDIKTIEARKELINKYFTFMNVRHPLERLLSLYRGKIADPHTEMPSLAARVLKHVRHDIFKTNQTLSDMKNPQTVLGPPSFLEFIIWMKETGTKNQHWSEQVVDCHPCAHKWDAIIRVETMIHDGKALLDRLRPDVQDDVIPVRHSHQTKSIESHDWLKMPEYKNVSDELVSFLLARYNRDMEMFGYHWDTVTQTASCAINTTSGPCC